MIACKMQAHLQFKKFILYQATGSNLCQDLVILAPMVIIPVTFPVSSKS